MIYLDIETLDFFQDPHIKALPRAQQLAAMRFGLAVTYDDYRNFTQTWLPHQIIDLYHYLVWCHQPVVGWNINAFDLPVIVANARRAGHNTIEIEYETITTIDLFDQIRQTTGRWYSLGAVAEANLTLTKLADGQQAATWLRSGDPADLQKAIEYCTADVQIVRQLHAKLRSGEHFILPHRLDRQELNTLHWRPEGYVQWIPDPLGDISTR